MPKLVVAMLAGLVFAGSPARASAAASDMHPDPDFLNAWERQNAGFPPREHGDARIEGDHRERAAVRPCRCADAKAVPPPNESSSRRAPLHETKR